MIFTSRNLATIIFTSIVIIATILLTIKLFGYGKYFSEYIIWNSTTADSLNNQPTIEIKSKEIVSEIHMRNHNEDATVK